MHGGHVSMIKNSNHLPYVEDVFTINKDRFNISQNIKKSFDPKRILNPGKCIQVYKWKPIFQRNN